MGFLEVFPAWAGLLLTLLGMVLLMSSPLPLGVGMLSGAFLLQLFFPLPWPEFGKSLGRGAIHEQTLFLALIVLLLLGFSAALRETGQIQRLIDRFTDWIGRSRWSMVAFPALIGLLPMPGGAIFSAPMVESAIGENPVSPARRTAANYWFRHIWEYWFPLYPGVILALSLTELPLGAFLPAMLPMTLFSLALGYGIILKPLRLKAEAGEAEKSGRALPFFQEMAPILRVVGMVIVGGPLHAGLTWMLQKNWPGLFWENIFWEQIPILLGLAWGFYWLMRHRGLTSSRLFQLLLSQKNIGLLFLVFALMLFREVLEANGAVGTLSEELKGAPLYLLVAGLPFIAGLVVGIAVGFVGASFPLVIALVAAGGVEPALPYYCLAYSCGYMGMMLSPVHVCLLVTNGYFKSSLHRVYVFLLPLCLGGVAASFLLFFLYRAWF